MMDGDEWAAIAHPGAVLRNFSSHEARSIAELLLMLAKRCRGQQAIVDKEDEADGGAGFQPACIAGYEPAPRWASRGIFRG